MNINIYLTYDGNCEAAFKFYEKNLGAKPGMLLRYSESPESMECSKDMANKIMHARITLGDAVIMGSDSPKERFHGQHGFSVNISTKSPEEAEQLFKALSENAQIHMPIGETFWAKRFGMLVDQFGIPWMVNCEKQP